MKKTLFFLAALAAVSLFSPSDLSAQGKFGKAFKKVVKAIDEVASDGSANTSSSNGMVITSPGKTIKVEFNGIEFSGEDVVVEFYITNTGADIDRYRVYLRSMKNEEGHAYSRSLGVGIRNSNEGSQDVKLEKDQKVLFKARAFGAKRAGKLTLDFDCRNVGDDKTNSPDGKLIIKDVPVNDE